MIAQMMKMAGVKTPEELVNKYTEEQFMAKYGKQFKKAQLGMQLKKAQQGWNGVPAGANNYGQPTMGPANQYNFSNMQTPGYGNNYQSEPFSSGILPTAPYNLNKPTPMIPEFNAYDPQGDQAGGKMANGIFEGAHSVPDSPFGSGGPGIGEVFDFANSAGNAISAVRDQNNKKKEKQQEDKLTKLNLEAINSIDVDAWRQQSESMAEQYNTFMQPKTGEKVFPVQGVGTNVLGMAQDGRQLFSDTDQHLTYAPNRQGEIQNTYSPEYTLYEDLEYEDAQFGGAFNTLGKQLKQGWGGGVPGIMNSGGAQFAGNMVNKAFKNNAGQQIGQTVGKGLKMIPGVGPIVSAIAEPVLGAIGGFIDDKWGSAGKIKGLQKGIDRTMNKTKGAAVGQNINYGYRGYKQDGGLIGEPQQGSSLKDEVTPLWGGGVAPFSTNYKLPEGGLTLKTIGDMHNGSKIQGQSGIGLAVGKDRIEAEGNEFLTKTLNRNGEVVTSIAGNMVIPKHLFNELEFMNPKGLKYKTQFKLLSEKENKANKIISTNLEAIANLDVLTSFDKLRERSYEAMEKGGDMILEGVAKTKTALMDNQQNTLVFAKENNLNAAELSKGKIKPETDVFTKSTVAQDGAELPMYDDGGELPIYKDGGDNPKPKKYKSAALAIKDGFKPKQVNGKTIYVKEITTKVGGETVTSTAQARIDIPKQSKNAYGAYGNVDEKLFNETKANNTWYNWERFDPSNSAHVLDFQTKFNAKAKEVGSTANIAPDSMFGDQTQTAKLLVNQAQTPPASNSEYAEVDPETGEVMAQIEPERNLLFDAVNATLPMWRPTDQEPFDNRRLSGEMFSLSHNQVEPVWAKGYRPELRVPYDISLQDQLNAITSQTRAGQKLAGYNPAAQSIMGGAAYDASTKVLADQFRQNQGFKDQIYSGNITTLNDAQLKNLAIYDQQANRQSQARSNTKEATQLALNSIDEKMNRHNLSNKTLGIAENMYNYRYTDRGRAQNWNPLADFDTQYKGGGGGLSPAEQYIQGQELMKRAKKQMNMQNDDDDNYKPSLAGTSIAKNGKSISKPLSKMPLVRALKMY